MLHCDPEILSLIALGEDPSAEHADHLDSCARCRADLEDTRRVVAAMRVDVPVGPPVPVPPRVWAGIAAATGVRVAPRDQATTSDPTTTPGLVTRPVRTATPGHAAELGRDRRPRWSGFTVAVAAAALVVGVATGSIVTRARWTDRPASTTPEVLAGTTLKPLLAVPAAHGNAQIVRTAQGPRLDVAVSALGSTTGDTFYEVWLIDRTVHRMVAVGILRGSTGEFVIPAGLDLAQYPVVDISVQHPGDPRHSGDSVLRGTIPG